MRKLLSPLSVANIGSPTALKTKLFVRRAVKICSSKMPWTPIRIRDILNISTPWKLHEDNSDFDPFQPKLSGVEGSPNEKAIIFLNIVARLLLSTALLENEAGRESVELIITECQVFYSKVGVIEDAYLQALSQLLTIWRGLETLLAGDSTASYRELEKLAAAAKERFSDQNQTIREVSLVLWSSTYYKDLLTDFEQHKHEAQLRAESIVRAIEKLRDTADSPSLADVSAAVTLYQAVNNRVRKGLVKKLLESIVPTIDTIKSQFACVASEPEMQTKCASYFTFYALVAKTLPNAAVDVSKELTTATSLVEQFR